MDVRVCDLKSNDFGWNYKESLQDTGFAVITGHSIEHGLIKKTQSAWREFFLREQEYKNLFINEKDNNSGYKGMRTEKALGAEKADLKEFYHWRPIRPLPHGLFGPTSTMYSQLEQLGLLLLNFIDFYDDWSFEYMEACEGSDNTILRTLYYPAMDYSTEKGAVRAAAHEDINLITLLVAASAPGLQVLDLQGNWHDVPHEDDSIVVNVGDMLQLSSKSQYKSTTHRVVNASDTNSDRISMPLFIHPHSSTVLAPGITARQFLNKRIAEITQKA